MGYPILSTRLYLLSYYHNVSCVKFHCELDFVAQLPVSQPPLVYQDVKHISLSKNKWGFRNSLPIAIADREMSVLSSEPAF